MARIHTVDALHRNNRLRRPELVANHLNIRRAKPLTRVLATTRTCERRTIKQLSCRAQDCHLVGKGISSLRQINSGGQREAATRRVPSSAVTKPLARVSDAASCAVRMLCISDDRRDPRSRDRRPTAGLAGDAPREKRRLGRAGAAPQGRRSANPRPLQGIPFNVGHPTGSQTCCPLF